MGLFFFEGRIFADSDIYFFVIYGIIELPPLQYRSILLAHFIFSSELFLARMTTLHHEKLEICMNLLERLGVKPKVHEAITILVISANAWEGYDAIFTLTEECQKIYNKQIDTNRLRLVVLPTLESACKSPHLERASFIIILDENLLGAENYPELKDILPFKAK